MAKGRVIINAEICKGCALCADVCPVGIIIMESKVLNSSGLLPAKVTEADKCTGCGNCATICPDSAISVYRLD